jgi:ATP-dependent Clp protease ATP-binding subunit ClpA
VWDRLSPDARAVMDRALAEADRLGHGYLGDDHILLGLLGDLDSPAAVVLREAGLDLAGARTKLARLTTAGLVPRCRADDVAALRTIGIDVEQVRERLSAAFGADAAGQPAVEPERLLYGVLRDAADLYGTGLSHRSRRHLAQLGWTLSPVNPATAVLAAHGIDARRLADRLTAATR